MIINSEKKKLTIWLAKVPKYLGDKILSFKKETNIGNLTIERNQEGASVNILLSEILQQCDIPTDYIIDIKDQEQPMYVIQNQENSLSIQGVINKECFIKPVINAKYMEYKRNIQSMQNQTENSIKVIDYFAEVRKGEKYGSLKELDILAKKRKKQLQDKKRERLERQDVLDMIFNAYDKHELWTVRDLADFSGQPVAYIQELVSEICVLNKKDHKNTYELKPEYKNK